ncbi:hypothetical protein ZWY2020_003574 [Hordeum vulgare]|nr:hypothetical protein ZWY2020_003574 [Hordeum vulgare]
MPATAAQHRKEAEPWRGTEGHQASVWQRRAEDCGPTREPDAKGLATEEHDEGRCWVRAHLELKVGESWSGSATSERRTTWEEWREGEGATPAAPVLPHAAAHPPQQLQRGLSREQGAVCVCVAWSEASDGEQGASGEATGTGELWQQRLGKRLVNRVEYSAIR